MGYHTFAGTPLSIKPPSIKPPPFSCKKDFRVKIEKYPRAQQVMLNKSKMPPLCVNERCIAFLASYATISCLSSIIGEKRICIACKHKQCIENFEWILEQQAVSSWSKSDIFSGIYNDYFT